MAALTARMNDAAAHGLSDHCVISTSSIILRVRLMAQMKHRVRMIISERFQRLWPRLGRARAAIVGDLSDHRRAAHTVQKS